ncbi:MAG TPA: hypothetical protein VK623_05285 [Flavobacterium sp.]|nr:hypothetical protein [Flavobacterium sp.]
MKKIEVPLQKRQGKLILFIVLALFCAWMTVLSVFSLITAFSWTPAIVAAILFSCLIGIGISLKKYFGWQNPNLVAESDGNTIRFFISHAAGESSKSEEIKLAGMKRFYQVTKSRRGIKDTYFEFEPKSGIFKTEVDVLPSLYELNPMTISKIMEFVAEVAPEIMLGYYGGSALGQLFKKP